MNQKMIQLLKKAATIAYSIGGVLLIAGMILSAVTTPAQAATAQQGAGNCGTGMAAKVESAPFTWTAPSGQVITSIYVKAGSENQPGGACNQLTPANPSSTCYIATWSNNNRTVTVVNTGAAGCHEISHVEFYTGTPQTETPTQPPSETPTETPPVTETPTQPPSETPTETPTVTETPTQPPSETPTETPPVTETPTQPPSETPTETPPVTETPTQPPSETPTETPPVTETPTQPPSETPTETPPVTETPTQPPSETPTETVTTTVTPTDPGTTTVTPPPGTTTPPPTVPPPSTTVTQSVLIPVTGANDNGVFNSQLFTSMGLAFLGLALLLHGLSFRARTF